MPSGLSAASSLPPTVMAFDEDSLQLQMLLAAIADGVVTTDAQGQVEHVFPLALQPLLHSELVGQSIHTLFSPPEVAIAQQACETVLTNHTKTSIEHHLADTGRWFRVEIAPFGHQLLWSWHDITTHKQQDLEHQAHLATLQAQMLERTTALQATSEQLVGEVVERHQVKATLNAIIEAVPGIVSWISADFKYLGVNRQLAEMFGLKPQEFVGQDIGFLQASTAFEQFVREFFASDCDEDAREIETLVNGEPRTYLIVVQKYNPGQGEAAFTVGIDITQRVNALEAVKRSREQLQAVLEAVPGIVSWIGADLTYMGVNRHLAATFGLAPEDFVGQPIGFLDAGEDFVSFVQDFFQDRAQDTFREVEAIVDGQVRNYLIAAQKYDDGQAAFTVGIDITERQQAVENLARSTEQLQAVLQAVPGIVSWMSADLTYLGVNHQLAEAFGLSVDDFVGKDIGFLDASQDFRDFVREFFLSSRQIDCREFESLIQGELRTYLIAFQKYDEGRAAFAVGIDATDRRRALEEAKRAEEKYRNIFENAVEGIFQTTAEGYYLSANPALARIYGYESPAQLMQNLHSVSEQLYVNPRDRALFIAQMEEFGRVVGFEAQIKRRDGAIRWISENARQVCDENGQLCYYEGTVEDITERKEAERMLREVNEELEERVQQRTQELQQLNMQLIMEMGERERVQGALKNSEAELKALFAAMTDIITVFDATGHYQKIVSTNSDTLIYSPDEALLGKHVSEVFPPETARLFLNYIEQALAVGETLNVEYPLRPSDRETTWFAATVSPLPNQSVMWVARNITERKKMLDALAAAEEKYRSIYENAAEGIFQTTLDGHYISANPALVKMYGYDSFAEMAARITNIGTNLYVEPGLREQFSQLLDRFESVTDFQAEVRRKDGTTIWTSENARIVRDERGRPLYYEGTVADITQRKQAENALRQEQEKSDRLLLNILPEPIAERLKRNEKAIAERYDQATILFADIVNFTTLSAETSPTELVNLLNDIFSVFDHLAEWYNLEKIKTIGDAYMVAGGIPATTDDHVTAIADMALDMQLAMTRFKRINGEPFSLRIGIHTGPVVAGVIGIKKFIYDLWGDTVNIASRMESQGCPDQIQVTEKTYHLLREKFFFEKRGWLDIKGRGRMETYWLRGRR